MEENIDDILVNFLNKGQLTDKEKLEFEQWKHNSEQNEKLGKIISKLEFQKKILDKHQKQDIVFTKIEYQVRQIKRKHRLVVLSSCAAVAILLIGFLFILQQDKVSEKDSTINQTYISGLSLNRPAAELILPSGKKRLLNEEKSTIIVSDSNGEMHTDKQTLIVKSNEIKAREPEYYTINIPFGGEYNLMLSDGTRIYLNAGSSLRYPDQFCGENREVFLTGEAYFEVTTDSLHPFIVHASDIVVQVLGTSFNINAYPDEKWVKTTLVKGRVKTQCGDNNIVMSPGTQVIYNKSTRATGYFHVNTTQFTSWKDGYYDFEDMPLGELLQIFSRWYNVKIEFAKPDLKETKFSGRLKRYDDIHTLFKMLEYTRDIRFIIVNDKIIIQKK